MTADLKILGKRLRNLRKDNNLTQNELSKMISLTPKMISFYENNERVPPINVLIKLAKIFQVSVDYLSGYSNIKSSTDTTTLDWESVLNIYPNALCISSEEKDLISYYKQLSLEDKRWIMGQMIDLLRKSDIKSNPRKTE